MGDWVSELRMISDYNSYINTKIREIHSNCLKKAKQGIYEYVCMYSELIDKKYVKHPIEKILEEIKKIDSKLNITITKDIFGEQETITYKISWKEEN